MNNQGLKRALLFSCGLVSADIYADGHTNPENCANQKESKECIDSAKVKLAPVTVVGNRVETDAAKYTGQISVLDAEDLTTSTNIIESMSQIPGFQTGNDFGRQLGSQFKIRGFGYQSESRVIIELDGVERSPSLFSNHISSFRTDSNLLKRVEVVKGGSSVLHGSGAIGGIVSMQTKDAEDFLRNGDEYGVTLGARYESNNSRNGHIAFAADPSNLPVDLVLYGKGSHFGDTELADGGVWDEDDQEQITESGNDEDINNYFIKGGWDITDEQRLSLSYFEYDEDAKTTWQTLWHLDPGDNPVIGHLEQKDWIVNYSFDSLENDLINFSARIYKSEAMYDRTSTGVSRGNPYRVDYANLDERQGFEMKNQSKFKTGEVSHDLVIGLDYQEREENASYVRNDVPSDFGSFPNFYDDLGIYAQDVVDFGQLELTLGARFDRFERGVDLPGRAKYDDSRLSPKLGVSYEVSEGIYLLGNYSETFRGPTPNETSADGALNPHYWYVPNLELQPEVAKEFEFGVAFDKTDILGEDELYLKATFFTGDIEDMISLKRAPELGTPPDIGDGYADYREYAQYKNIANARRRGFELEGKYQIADWQFAAGFEHIKLIDDADSSLLQASTDKLFFNAEYTHQPWDLTAGVKMTHWFEPERDEYTRIIRGKEYHYIKDEYTILDFKSSWKPSQVLGGDLTVHFGVNNLLDDKRIHQDRYETTAAVGKGRNIYLAVETYF